MTFTTRALVVAEAPAAAGALAARLDRLGVETCTAAGDGAARAEARARPVDAVIIEASRRPIADAARLAREVKEAARPRLLAVLVVAGADADQAEDCDAIDAVLRAPAHPAQIASRMDMVVRLAVMEDEARLRASTMGKHGAPVDLRLDRTHFAKPQILFAGPPTPYYLGLERALTAAGADVVAAFTSFVAFDFLHERDFDAVVVNAGESLEPALTICSSLRRNTRLYHTPSLLMVDIDAFNEVDQAFDRGVSDLLPNFAPPRELASRVASLARERRRREAIKSAFAQVRLPQVTDTATGLASPAFFGEHLNAMAQRARPIGRPLSVVVMHASAPRDVGDEARDAALRQLGSMVRHLMRVEDLGARLDSSVFVIAMPGSERSSAQAAAARLEAVAECTAFDGGQGTAPFQLQIDAAVAQLDDGEAGSELLARAVRRFERRARAS